ncbi:MAG TPA: transposase [Candidatus Berkiella sp.]|nr:transposase [Candidatus Berkiella sp.]
MGRTRRKFTKEFKVEAVKLVTIHGYSVEEAAKNLGVGKSSLCKWVREYRDANEDTNQVFPGKGNLNPQDAEIKKLQKALAKITRERDILKKRWDTLQKTPIKVSIH